MGKAKKRCTSSKELIKDNMFWVSFLAQVVKIPSTFIIFMYIYNVNIISRRYEASSKDIYLSKNTQSKNAMLKAQKLTLVQHY
jgi:hypothetical protein